MFDKPQLPHFLISYFFAIPRLATTFQHYRDWKFSKSMSVLHLPSFQWEFSAYHSLILCTTANWYESEAIRYANIPRWKMGRTLLGTLDLIAKTFRQKSVKVQFEHVRYLCPVICHIESSFYVQNVDLTANDT